MTPELIEKFVKHAGMDVIDINTEIVRRDILVMFQKPEKPKL